jgi:hypothetical protein
MGFAVDLAPLYADFAVDVTLTPQIGSPSNGRAIHDHPGQVLLGDGVAQTEHALRYPVATFPGVKVGDVFTVEGASYTVATAPIGTLDGLELTVELGKNGT